MTEREQLVREESMQLAIDNNLSCYYFNGKRNPTRLYCIWQDLKKRCLNPNHKFFHIYGGRGILLFPEWCSFIPFSTWARSNGYSNTLEIDRKNNDGDYEPSNCRWVTVRINAVNRSTFKGGAYLHKKSNSFRSQISFKNRKIHLGCFKTMAEAISTYRYAFAIAECGIQPRKLT